MRGQQSGFALLLMLFVLLSAGIAGLARTQAYSGVAAPGFTADQYALQTARQGLLTYAALYPWFYGPRGAGPGHLPCPDTDAVNWAVWSQASSRDGPNPPCGSDANATGQLPRHVNLPGHRYVFHVEPYQRLAYHVASEMINNPVNRIVNDAVIKGEQGQWPFVAWVRQPPDEASQTQFTTSRVPVSRESLLPGVRRSVAAWLLAQVNSERGEVCLLPPEWSSASSSPEVPGVLSLIAQRESEHLVQSMTQSSTQPEDSLHSCQDYPPQDMAADDRLIEGVPLASHWFVRNGWHQRVVIQSTESCAAGLSGTCILVSASPGLRTDTSDERLYFIWKAAS